MRKYIYILNIALALGAVSCNKTDVVIDENDGAAISFAPQTIETRALVNDVEGLRSQTLKVWDLWSGQDDPYIDNTLVYSEGSWQYGTEKTYYWKEGTHKFFSYSNDAACAYDEETLTVSKTLTTADAGQVDILYSDLFVTTAADWKATEGNTADSPVPLNFNHLFSAVAITVQNCSGNVVKLTSVSKPAIPNKGSATIDYSATASTGTNETNQLVPTYGNVSVDGAFVTATFPENGITLSAAAEATDDTPAVEGGKADVLAQAAATENGYCLVWPQEINGDDDDKIKITLGYTMEGENYTKVVTLPATTWERGNKYTYTLQIYPTDVRLIFKVVPWDVGEAGSIDSSTGSINMSNVTWMNTKVKLTQGGAETNTVVDGAYTVNMFYKPYVKDITTGEWKQYTDNNGYYPAQGYFTVNYPLSGLFKIDLIPAYGESEVDSDKYEIWIYDSTLVNPNDAEHPGGFRAIYPDGESITNNTVYFQVRAASGQDNALHKAQVNIWFMPDGSDEWISAYSEIRANYALTIPAVSGN